jgi:hypothetical protein
VSEPCILYRSGRALPVVIQPRFLDQGTRNPVDLLIGERVTVIPGDAVDRTRPRPAFEQTKQPGSQHVAMFDHLIEGAL